MAKELDLHKTVVFFVKDIVRDAYHEPLGDAIVECDLGGRIIDTKKVLGAFVELAKTVGNTKVEYTCRKVFYAAAVYDSGSFEGSGNRFFFFGCTIIQHIHQAICLCK